MHRGSRYSRTVECHLRSVCPDKCSLVGEVMELDKHCPEYIPCCYIHSIPPLLLYSPLFHRSTTSQHPHQPRLHLLRWMRFIFHSSPTDPSLCVLSELMDLVRVLVHGRCKRQAHNARSTLHTIIAISVWRELKWSVVLVAQSRPWMKNLKCMQKII